MAADRRRKLQDVVRARSDAQRQGVPLLLEWARNVSHNDKEGGLVCVAPGLFLGNKMAAADGDLLTRKGIVGVCAVGAKQMFNGPGHHIRIEDDGTESMLPYFDDAIAFIHLQRQRGGVLVHCKGGMSRSPTLVVAYLMRHEHLSLIDAMEVCSLARPAAILGANFVDDLEVYENTLQDEFRWHHAITMADEAAIVAVGPRQPGPSKQDVQAECQRLLELVQEWCIGQAFGESREPRLEMREAAIIAITDYADSQGWKKATKNAASMRK